jgi:hypothetical protein
VQSVSPRSTLLSAATRLRGAVGEYSSHVIAVLSVHRQALAVVDRVVEVAQQDGAQDAAVDGLIAGSVRLGGKGHRLQLAQVFGHEADARAGQGGAGHERVPQVRRRVISRAVD